MNNTVSALRNSGVSAFQGFIYAIIYGDNSVPEQTVRKNEVSTFQGFGIAGFHCSPNTVVALFPYPRYASLLNTAILNGQRVDSMLNILGLTKSGNLTRNIPQLTCESSDNEVLRVETDCSSVYLGGNETSDATLVTIEASSPSASVAVPFRVWYPTAVLLSPDVIELSPIRGLYTSSNGTCRQAYEYLNLYIEAAFISGTERQPVFVGPLVGEILESSDESVLRVEFDSDFIRLVGVSAGQARVQLTDSQGQIYTSPNITVTETAVTVEELSLSLYSSLMPRTNPASLPGTPYLETALVALRADLEHIDVELEVIPEAVLSNNRNYQLSPSNGLVLSSNSPETIAVVDELQVMVRGSGTGQILQGRIQSSCNGAESLSTTEFVDITINPIETLEVTVTGEATLALQVDSDILSIPFQTYYSVELIHQDGTRVSVTTDSRLQFQSEYDLTFEESTIDVSNISSSGRVNFTAWYSYNEIVVVSQPVYIEIIEIESISLTATPYPNYSQWPAEGDLLLERFNGTSLYQQAELSVTATLSNGSIVDVSSSTFLEYVTAGDASLDIEEGKVEPLTPGIAKIYAYLDSRFNDSIELQVNDSDVYAVMIVEFIIPQENANILSTVAGAVVRPIISVRFSDDTYYSSFITDEGLAVPNTLELTSSDPNVIEVNEDGTITVQSNSVESVSVMASLLDGSSSIIRPFVVDLTPQLGEIDVVISPPPSSASDVLTYMLIANIDGYSLGAAEFIVYYDPDVLELLSVSPGNDLPADHVVSQGYGDTPGSLRFGGITPSSVSNTTTAHVVTVEFSILQPMNTYPDFNVLVMTLAGGEEPYPNIGEPTPRFSPPASYGPAPALPNSTLACSSPPCTPEQCTALNGFSPAGDANGDCLFNLVDALYANEVRAQLNLPDIEPALLPHQLNAIDANKNGIYDPADVLFLVEGRMGLFPLIRDITLLPVDLEGSDCVLTINVTLQDWNGVLNEDAFMYFGLFHPDPSFETEYDDTTLRIGEKLSISAPENHYGGWIEAQNYSRGTYGIQTNPGNIAQTDIGFILVYGTLDTSGQPSNERTQFLFGQPSNPSAYSSLNVTFMPLEGLPSVSVYRTSVNPLVFFDNTINATFCYNTFPPVITIGLPLVIVSFRESSLPGTPIRVFSATDRDAPLPAGDILFSLEDVNPPGVIAIDAVTGRVFIAMALDREQSDSVTATVVATDQGPHVSTRMRDTRNLRVNIIDVNDNEPLANETFYSIRVLESLPVVAGRSASILQFPGNDRDFDEDNNMISSVRVTEGDDGQVVSSTFAAESINPQGGSFVISLYLIRPLDRETLDMYNLTLTIFDSGNPPLSSSVSVSVQVIDANDFRPVFTSADRVSLTENNDVGVSILTVTAVDNDIGSNAIFNFTLNSVFVADDFGMVDVSAQPVFGYFILDPVTGEIVANRTFDREDEYSFILNIVAEEEGIDDIASAVQRVWVMICDENDNAPEFEQEIFYARIAENSEESTLVTIVNASDADLGPFCPSNAANSAGNNMIRYELLTEDVPFTIVPETGEILVNGSLDFESDTVEYSIQIMAYDLGTVSLTSMTNLTIQVTDVNDNPPVLSRDVYYNVAIENSTVGTVVIDFIEATDIDSGDNEIVNFRLEGPGSEDFSIDPASGVITIAMTLDRERQREYNLTLIAYNPVDPDINDTALVRIEIIDINDTPPVFNATLYTARISENLPIGAVAATVYATDADENRMISYRLAEPSDEFAINPLTGEIFTLVNLCTQNDISYGLTVTALDRPGGQLTLSTNVSVTIDVYDDNSFSPNFTRSEYVAIVEDGVEAGVPILRVEANDDDICSPPFSYSIVDSSLFVIDNETGVIFTAASLLKSVASEYFITVEAEDSGTDNPLTGDARVIVLVGETVPVEFMTNVGFKVSESRKVPQENYTDINFYEQAFDFFYDYNAIDPTPSIEVDVTYGDTVLREDIELAKLPATRANAVLLTPTVPYDRRVVQVAMVAVDQYGSNRVDEATVFVTASTEINGETVNVSNSEQTGGQLSTAIVSVVLPVDWFNSTRSVRISYGVEGSSPSSNILMASLVPFPEFEKNCLNADLPFLLVLAPSYSLYANQVIDVPVVAWQTTEYPPSSIALQCTVGSGLQFSGAISVSRGWEVIPEDNFPLLTQLRFSATRVTNITSPLSFEFVANMSVRVLSNSVNTSTISCIKIDTVDTEGNFERFSEALMVDSSGCRPGTGQVRISDDVLVGALPINSQTVLINDAVLSGNRRVYYPSVAGVVLSAQPQITSIISTGQLLSSDGMFTCTSTNDDILKVESNCGQVFMDGTESRGAEVAYITVNARNVNGGDNSVGPTSFSVDLEYHVWYPDFPLSNFTAFDKMLNLVEGWMRSNDVPTSTPNCVQQFQSADIYAAATFRLGSSSVTLRVENMLNLQSANPAVATISGTTVRGVSPGTSIISAINNRRTSNPTLASFVVTTDSSPVRAVEFDTIYASSFSVDLPEPLPYADSEPFSARLDPNLRFETQTASLVSTVVFSDATRLRVSANDGLTYVALNTSVVMVAGSILTAVSSGSGELLQVTWNSCGNSQVLAQNKQFDISLLVPEIQVSVPNTVLVHPSDPASNLIDVSTQTTIRVEQVSRLGDDVLSVVDITSQEDTVYTFNPEGILSITTNGIVTVATPNVNATVTLTISNPLSDSTSVTFYTVYSLSLLTSPSPYPSYPGSDSVELTVLHPIANTAVYQRAQILAVLTLAVPEQTSIQSAYDVTSHRSLTYSSSPSSVASVSPEGILIPVSNGNVQVSISAPPLQSMENFAVIPSPTLVSSIDRIQLSSGADAIVGQRGEVASDSLSVSLTLSDGTRIEEVFTLSGQVYPSLLTVTGNDPNLFSVNPITGQLTILEGRHTPVSLTITTNQSTNVLSQTFEFYINLEPFAGELDLGSPTSQVVPPIASGEVFSVPVRMNIHQTLGAFEIGVTYSNDLLELISVSVGSDLPSNILFENSLREFQGYVYFGGVTRSSQPINIGVREVAVLTFRVGTRNNRVATITGEIISLLDRSHPALEVKLSPSPDVNIGVFIGNEILDTNLPDVEMQRDIARAALAPTVTPCSGGIPIDGTEEGDLNGDCVFNISDVLHFEQTDFVCATSLDRDYNRDGVCNVFDIMFMLRANYRIVQFIESITISPVDPIACFLTIDVTLAGRGSRVENGARTNLLFGLFHRDRAFQGQFDATTIFIGVGNTVELVGNQPPSSNGGFFNASEVGVGEFQVVLNTPISITNIGLVIVQARIDSYFTLNASRTEIHSGNLSIPIQYPQYINANIVHPIGVQIPFQFYLGFNPLLYFNQTFTSPDCINNEGPRFFPNITTVEVYENLEVGSVVTVVFANDTDSGPNAEVVYSFYVASDEIERTFAINSTTGEVRLLSSLNRERIESYSIGLQAFDRGVVNTRGGIGQLNVRVLDVNDEEPVFEQDPYLPRNVPEDAPIGYPVVTVRANDMDAGENGTVTYTLLDPTDTFQIDPTSGDITTNMTLDYETQQLYMLVVDATDNGSPSLSSNATVIVNVDPVNDNAPNCYPTERIALVSESESNGTAFFLLNVSDADLGADHSTLSFTLAEESDEFNVVKINDTYAVLVTITEDLDRLARPFYNVTIVVSDVDGQSCSILVSVIVVEPLNFDFTIQRPGAGFFSSSTQQVREQNSFLREVSFFGNSFNTGTISGSLNGQTGEASYTRSPQPPTRLDGILHENQVWPDLPIIAAAIQLRDSSLNTVVDETDVFLQIVPSNPTTTIAPINGSTCEREVDSISGICAAEIEVPSSWFVEYSSVRVTATTSDGVSVGLGEVDLMPVTVDVSDFTENLVIEVPSYTLYPGTTFTIWVGASPLIDIKAFQFSLEVPSSVRLGSIDEDEKWGCTDEYDATTNRTDFICFRAHPGQSQASLIGTDRFFGVQASVADEVITFDDIIIHAEVSSIASTYGSIISAPRPALIFTRDNISISPGILNLEQHQVRGIFATAERSELVNTVPLNGDPMTIPITAYAIYDRLNPRFGVVVADQPSSLACSSSDPNLAVDSGCFISMTSNFTSCSSETTVEVEHTQSSSTFSLPVRIWCYHNSEIDLSDPILERVSNWKTSNCNEDRFQQSRFKVWGWFRAGDQISPRVDITEYLADDLVSSNDSIAVVDGGSRTVSGMAEGEAVIFLSTLPGVSTFIEVQEMFVEVYSLETSIFTSVSLQVTPSTYSTSSALTLSAILDNSFSDIGVEGYSAAYVYFTDGALYIIPQSNLNVTTVTPATVASNNDGTIRSISRGTAEIEISWIPSECSTQEPLANDVALFEVTTPVPVELELEISEEVITGNTRGVPGIATANMSEITVSLVYSNGAVRTLSASEYTIIPSTSLTVTANAGNTGHTVAANPTTNSTSGTITVTYDPITGDRIREYADFTIVNAVSADVMLFSYPDAVRQPSLLITLEILGTTGILQQAQVYAEVSLSDGFTHTIVPTSFIDGGSGTVSYDSDNGVVTGLSNGGTTVRFIVGEFTLPQVIIDVSGVQLQVQSISSLTLEDLSVTQKRVVVGLTFSDGMVIDDIINYNPLLLSLVQFSISPAGVATINETSLILTITGNHYDLVNLTATTTNAVSNTVRFAANLEPEVGQLDIGQQMGVPQPPVSADELFSTDIRVNIGEDEDIGAYHLVTSYEPTEVAGLSITLTLPGLYFINADTTNGVIHTLYLSIFGFEIEESEPTIARFNYQALRDNTLTTLTSELRVLVDKSIDQITTSGPSSIDVLIGSVASSRGRRSSPRLPRQTAASPMQDFNSDSRIDIADAAYLMRYIGEGEGSVNLAAADANQDGVVTVADVIYLARASAGLVPFLDRLYVTTVSPTSDCLLDIQANITFSAEEFTNNRTSVYFILSHPQFKNEIGLSNALVGTQLPIRDDTSVIFKAAALEERGAYGVSLNTPLDRQAENVGVSVVVYTEDDATISSGLDRLAVFTKFQRSTFVSSSELVPSLRNVSLDPRLSDFNVLDPDGFSPFTSVTNNERSDYCRFAGQSISISLLENIPVNSAVYNFTAYEPPFPSYMENYTIVSTTQEGHFTLESETGVLQLTQPLDFETTPNYTLVINAYSIQGGYNIGQVTLNITVLDLNDFAPVFIDPENYVTSIYENFTTSISDPVISVVAFDLDDGVNGQFSFSLVDPTGTFNITTVGETGLIFLVGPLDREMTETYNLTVYVIDMGIQIVLNSSASVIINVLDINDNSPIFRELAYTVMVRESIFTGTDVTIPNFQIVATDADIGDNGIVLLTLDPNNLEPSKPFSLNSAGNLTVISSLDRETRASYNYTVMAVDMGEEPLSSFVELNIIIEDSNDHPPVFSSTNEMMITLEEDTPIGTLITRIEATDNDIGNNALIFFSILPTNVPFSIDPVSGVISVSQRLNISDEHQHMLTIVANNSLGDVPQSANSNIAINVIEKQVITFDVGRSGFLFGEPQRLMEGRRYLQQVGALFNENVGTSVSVNGGINTATTGEIDQLEVPNLGDVAVKVKGSVLDSRVRHSLRTVTAFVQAYDTRNVIARPTLVEVSVSPSAQLRALGTVNLVTETCTTSEDLGFCVVRIQLPDEWFARDSTIETTDTVTVWANPAGQGSESRIIIGDNLVVEHSPAYSVSFNFNRIILIEPSHVIYPNQTFSVEVYVVSPLDSPVLYNRVQANILTSNAVASLVGIDYDEDNWNCCE